MHGVDVRFREDRRRCGDNGRNEYLSSLSKLAEVTGARVPVDIRNHVGPPKMFHDVRLCCEKRLVSDLIVTGAHNFEMTFGGSDKLMCAL